MLRFSISINSSLTLLKKGIKLSLIALFGLRGYSLDSNGPKLSKFSKNMCIASLSSKSCGKVSFPNSLRILKQNE